MAMPEIAISIDHYTWALPISVGWWNGVFTRGLDIRILCVRIRLWVIK